MVIKAMKWPLRQHFSKKYQVNLVLNKLEGLSPNDSEEAKLYVDLKWKGPKSALGSRFRSMKREKTNALPVENSGSVSWDKKFEHVCVLTNDKDGVFQPWHVHLVLCEVTYCILLFGFVSSLGNRMPLQWPWFYWILLITLSFSYIWRASSCLLSTS